MSESSQQRKSQDSAMIEPTNGSNEKSTSETDMHDITTNNNRESSHYPTPPILPPKSSDAYDEKPWTFDEKPYQYDIPPMEGDPWKKCYEFVKSYDDGMVGAWKDEIEHLLIFASLFSAVVTAFAVDVYKGLQTDPDDVQTFLLTQIAIQLGTNTSIMQSVSPKSLNSATSALNIQVNVFIFLSLALSLSTVLIGIVCLQWLREYVRDIGAMPKEAVAVRQIRYEGLVDWYVPGILSGLSVLLQIALVLFFVGLLQLLWSLNTIVAALVTVAVALTLLFLAVTTIIPAFQNIRFVRGSLQNTQCPYKSPQSWIFHRLTLHTTHFLSSIINYPIASNTLPLSSDHQAEKHLDCDQGWDYYDIRWYEARNKKNSRFVRHDNDNIKALSWIEKTYAAMRPDVVDAIAHCIRDISPNAESHIAAPSEALSRFRYSGKRNEVALIFFLEKYEGAWPVEYQVPYIASLIRASNSLQYEFLDSFRIVRHFNTVYAPHDLLTQLLMLIKQLLYQSKITTTSDLVAVFRHIKMILSSREVVHSISGDEKTSRNKIHIQNIFDLMDGVYVLSNRLWMETHGLTLNDQNTYHYTFHSYDNLKSMIRECALGIISVSSRQNKWDSKAKTVHNLEHCIADLGGLDEVFRTDYETRLAWSDVLLDII